MPSKMQTIQASAAKVQEIQIQPSAADKKRNKPKRPLSAYNLFYRFKRAKILEAHKKGDDSNEAINRLIAAVPGLEDYPAIAARMTAEQVNEISRNEIRSALLDNLSPKDTRNRTHRKSDNGNTLSFLEMNRIMVASWKSVGDVTRVVFEELADEGRRMYHKRVAEYEEKYPSPPSPPKKKVKVNSGAAVAAATTPKKVRAKEAHVVETANKKMELVPSDTLLDPEKKAGLKILHVGRPSTSTPKKKQAPRSKRNVVAAPLPLTVTSAVTPPATPPPDSNDPAASYFDSIDLDLEGPLPPFGDIFGLENNSPYSSGHEDDILSNIMQQPCPSSPTGVSMCELDDFPNLPFSPVEEHDEAPSSMLFTSVDDFMELIVTLDERL